MKYSLCAISAIALTVLATSCGNSSKGNAGLSDNYIDLTPAFGGPKVDLASIIDTAYLLPLDNSEDALLGLISSIAFGKDNIALLTGYPDYGISFFDKDGKFLRRYGTGSGPGEVSYAFRIIYSGNTDRFIMYDASEQLKLYDGNGNYVDSKVVPYSVSVFQSATLGDELIFGVMPFIRNDKLGAYSECRIIVTDMDINFRKGFAPTPTDSIDSEYLLVQSSQLVTTSKGVYFTAPHSDELYRYDGDSVAHIELEYPQKINYEGRPSGNTAAYEYETSQKGYSFSDLQIVNGVWLFQFYYGATDEQVSIVRDAATGAVSQIDCGGLSPAENTSIGDFLVAPIYFDDLEGKMPFFEKILSPADAERLNKMTDDDNNMLLFYRISGKRVSEISQK